MYLVTSRMLRAGANYGLGRIVWDLQRRVPGRLLLPSHR
jgi:hypothetical protein